MKNDRTPLERALAEVIEDARLDQGWSQEKLAERTANAGRGMAQVTVSRIIRGESPMRLNYLEAFAQALDIPLSALFRLAEGKMPKTAEAMPVTESEAQASAPAPSAGRTRKPRRVTGEHPEA